MAASGQQAAGRGDRRRGFSGLALAIAFRQGLGEGFSVICRSGTR